MLLFAGLRDRLGGREAIEVELPEEATVARLRDELERSHPSLAGAVYRVALDATYAAEQEPVPAGAEIALVPPVSGG